MDASTVSLVAIAALIVPLVGIIAAMTPWLMRGNECFAVTVPASAQSNPEIKRLKRSYSVWIGALTLVLTVIVVFLLLFGDPTAALVALTAATLALTGGSFALMLLYRRRVQRLKERLGWQADSNVRSTVVGEEMPVPLSLWWQALNLPVIAITVAIGVMGYASMPDLIPIHMGIDGQVNDWAEKSPFVVMFAPALQLFLTVVLAFCQWAILRSKRPNAPEAPVSSAYAYGRFARAQSVFLVAMGVVLNISIIAMQLSMVGVMSLAAAGGAVSVAAVIAVIGVVVLSVRYGQSGARAMGAPSEGAAMLYDDDRYWKLGVFYVNPGDPSLFVPKRFGVGWTANFGRPASWLLLAGLVALVAGFVWLAFAML